MYGKILLPYDFGNTFTNVPEQLVKLTNKNPNAVITIFHVISENEMADNVKYHGKHFDDIEKGKVEELKPFTDQLDELGLNYEIVIRSGRVINELLNEIKENEYEVVIMSNKRAKMELKHVLGHVTHKVAKRVNTPVMIIK
ncbi:universal stress protein [Lacicoccus alkaliphilus]|uniref:Nucleotide-binding universal stress protein, UspA family n=1 Tax=Lacicoccus alkaliphilus DSM 16010 TaxID=1123231 RepID=A0A1M7AS69_9BACL|nr:universal stress protein [Salinicoccus alkaliphilus]SHL45568.1 Nucleotide-binding universal stress protein, UspA family [Salinicoccus alkaliphilus DSM 16010]